jgi:5S rRNA maturation endonuclease (ribonuclease M5)
MDLDGKTDEELRELRNKINRKLENDQGLTMDINEIRETKVRNLTGVEAAKSIALISEEAAEEV